MNIPKCLYEKRKELRFSQKSLASRLGKHRTYVSKVENGVRALSFDELKKYCLALDIDIKIFL